jgi:hypothetical protein
MKSASAIFAALLAGASGISWGFQDATPQLIAKPGLYKALTEPPCSYCSTQDRKGIVKPNDRVLSWLRAEHNGGAFPIRHFIAGPRVINDTYGLFFYDADGGYVAAYEKDYGFEFYGWRGGVMVARGKDGTLWSALTGEAFSGPQKGKKLNRIPSLVTDWGYWLMLHPESTAYDLFDGKRYPVTELSEEVSRLAKLSMGAANTKMSPTAMILGVEAGGGYKAYPLNESVERACYLDSVGGTEVAVLWYGATRTATAFIPSLDGQKLTLFADDVSPETAPFKDKETGTRWTIAGRGVDGPLKGKELTWVKSIQCRWYAWSAERPNSQIYAPPTVSRAPGG